MVKDRIFLKSHFLLVLKAKCPRTLSLDTLSSLYLSLSDYILYCGLQCDLYSSNVHILVSNLNIFPKFRQVYPTGYQTCLVGLPVWTDISTFPKSNFLFPPLRLYLSPLFPISRNHIKLSFILYIFHYYIHSFIPLWLIFKKDSKFCHIRQHDLST